MKIKKAFCILSEWTFSFVRQPFLIFALLILISPLSFSQEVISKTDIQIPGQSYSLIQLFNLIESQSVFRFSYRHSDLDAEFQYHSKKKKTELSQILSDISTLTGLAFHRINNTIHVRMESSHSGNVDLPITSKRILNGNVFSEEDNEPLPGVSILIKGTNQGTVTDLDGRFKIGLESANVELVFSFVGYKSKIIQIGNLSEIEIGLSPDIASLENVVIIGFGERDFKDLTGSISQIESDVVEKTTALSPQISMQGRLPGVLVTSAGGDPTARPVVRVRGIGTWGYSEPLYVIDGIPVAEAWAESAELNGNDGLFNDMRGNQNIFNTINSADVESISVLKDASAAAIYGVRAANGVILITTKKGRQGKPKVSFNSSLGFQNIPNTYDVLNTHEFSELNHEMLTNAGVDPSLHPDLYKWYDRTNQAYFKNLSVDEDWQKAALNNNALIQDHNISVGGGNDKSIYYTSLGFSQMESPIKWKRSDRYSFSVRSEHQLASWIKLGQNLRYSILKTDNSSTEDLRQLALIQPWQPIYNQQNTFSDYDSDKYGPESVRNIFALRDYQTDEYNIYRTLARIYGEISPISGLKIRASLFADLTNNQREFTRDKGGDRFRKTIFYPGYYIVQRQANTLNLQRELLINYIKHWKDHSFDFILNGSWQSIDEKFIQSSSDNGAYDDAGIIDEASSSATSLKNGNALIGFFGRISYNYNSKYYVDFTYRKDGTSRFARGYRWGSFPSLAMAWRISSEKFMSSNSLVSDLKLRAGWGRLGNQVTGLYQYLSLANVAPKYLSGGNNSQANNDLAQGGAYFPSLSNKELTWETVETTNLGIDALLFGNKLAFTAEYYWRKTKDILQILAIPSVAGYQESPNQNIGSVLNQGLELEAKYQFVLGKFKFNLTGNLTTIKNKVLKLQGGLPLTVGNTRIEEGMPIGYLWGYKVGGIFNNQSEVLNWLKTHHDSEGNAKMPGDLWFQDIYGSGSTEAQIKVPVKDGLINNLDRTYLGKTIPGYFYGIGIDANFKAFDISLFFQGIGDVQKVNLAKWDGEGLSRLGINRWKTTLDRWTPENAMASIPRAVLNDPAGNERFSDRWVENAGFFRFKNIQLGYTLPDRSLEKLGLTDLRVYLDGSNLFTLTQWSGLDPENDEIPLPRMTKIGFSVSF